MPLIPDSIHIWRDAQGSHHFQWATDGDAHPVSIEVLGVPAAPPVEPGGPGLAWQARIAGLDPTARHFFRVGDASGVSVTTAARGLGIEGGVNFRDFGGYPTADGRRVRWGRLFRCGHLSTLTPRGVEQLLGLELDLICDFRRPDEQAYEPNPLPPERAPRHLFLAITPGSQGNTLQGDRGEIRDRADMHAFMCGINRAFVDAQSDRFRTLFEALLTEAPDRVLIHCAAGKDRTGFAAAMLLSALGVAWPDVERDYLLTRHYFTPAEEMARVRGKYRIDHLSDDAVEPMLSVEPAFLATARAAIEQGWGSLDHYLAEALGLGTAERAALQARFLEA